MIIMIMKPKQTVCMAPPFPGRTSTNELCLCLRGVHSTIQHSMINIELINCYLPIQISQQPVHSPENTSFIRADEPSPDNWIFSNDIDFDLKLNPPLFSFTWVGEPSCQWLALEEAVHHHLCGELLHHLHLEQLLLGEKVFHFFHHPISPQTYLDAFPPQFSLR